jgi:hypothetical protein
MIVEKYEYFVSSIAEIDESTIKKGTHNISRNIILKKNN